MVVTAQPTVSAMILTPWADRKEGGQVDMRCTARKPRVRSHRGVTWVTEEPDMSFRWGMSTVSANSRYYI